MLTRRTAIQSAAAALAGAPHVLRAARRAGDKPNLLFLWTDEQRADTIAAYGGRYRTPALDRLASESVVFDRAYVSQPVCTPSRSTVMTGLWPHQAGTVNNNIPLRAGTRAMPELLGDSAYRTAYMGKWHLGDEIFPQHGFAEWQAIEDHYQAHFSPGRDRNLRSAYHHFLTKLGYKPGEEGSFSRSFCTKLPVEHSKPSFLANEASRFILANRSEPWMLYVNFLEPHPPYGSVLDDLHPPEETPLPANYPGIPETGEPEWYKRRRASLLKRQGKTNFERTIRNYAGLCALVDQAVQRILWSLEVSGSAENTIVVFTSDHGDMMGSHSLLQKQVMYEESVRVPLLLRAPFRRWKPSVVRGPVSHIDLVPTLLDLLGRRQAAEGLPGASLVPAIESGSHNADAFLEWTADEKDSGPGPDGRAAISADGYKLVLYAGDRSLLFDRNKDPLEMNNVYGRPEYRGVEARLRRGIEAWQKRTVDTFALP